jgi:hypothetical protein
VAQVSADDRAARSLHNGAIPIALECHPVKRLIADLIYQVLVEFLSEILIRLAEWLSALPWL